MPDPTPKKNDAPAQIEFTVTLQMPDGTKAPVKFRAPENLSDGDVGTLALQQFKLQTGLIPNTEKNSGLFAFGNPGYSNEMAHDDQMTRVLPGRAVQAAGFLTGEPWVVGAGPSAGRAFDYWLRTKMGQKPDRPTAGQVLGDVAEGAIEGYGPRLGARVVASTAGRIAAMPASGSILGGIPNAVAQGTSDVVARPLARGLSMITPDAVGATTSEIAGQVGARAASLPAEIAARAGGATGENMALMRSMIQKGWSAYGAAKVLTNGDPKATQVLVDWWTRVKP